MTLSTRQIIEAASRVTSLPANVITGERRTRELVLVRDAIAALSKEHLYRSDDSIAKMFGRHRSSVCYGIKRHKDRINTNQYYKKLYETIERKAGLSATEA
jgi:chromosomal replication initiation ATPase DnaA